MAGTLLIRDRAQQDKAHDLLEQVLLAAKNCGVNTVEAELSLGHGFTVTARERALEKVEHETGRALSVAVYHHTKKGTATTTDLSRGAIEKTLLTAADIARHVDGDPCHGLAETEIADGALPELDLFHPWSLSVEEAIEMVVSCEQIGFSADARIVNSDSTMLGTHQGVSGYANSRGTLAAWEWTSHFMESALVAKDQNGLQRDGWQTVSRVPDELLSLEALAAETARRTVARLKARRAPTQRCHILFEAPVAKSLFGSFVAAVSGDAQYKKNTFFLDAIHKAVFADHIQIREEPFLKRAIGSCPLDSDGVLPIARDIVRDGKLCSYFLDHYAARRLKLLSTGNAGGIHNLIVTPGKKDFSALLRQMDRGVLVTDTLGFGVDQLTGDYSQGIAGFWVEQGEIQYPLEEITVAGSLPEMFMRIAEVGSDVDARSSIQTGSILIEDMMLAGS